MNLTSKLRALDDPIRVGVVGVGIFGSQLVHSIESTEGMETVAIAELDPDKAATTFRRTGVESTQIDRVDDAAAVNATIEAGRRAVVSDGVAVVDADVDVVVDATGNPNVAARHGYRTLMGGTHFVNVSVEADTVCGPLLADVADANDVTYSLAYGDQPALIVDLCEWAGSAGFEVVAAGKASREPQHYGTPDDAIERHDHIESFGEGIDPNPEMYNTFMDGTKPAVESVAAANALGMGVDTDGQHKPTIPLAEMPEVFRPVEEGGVLDRTGVVDAVTPTSVSFSIFVVTYTESEQLRQYYRQRPSVPTSPDGAYQVFHRPHHFATETTVSIASAAILNEPTGAPVGQTAEVVAAAKKDLEPGDTIDGGGGYTIYGVAENADTATEEGYVPFELLAGAEVVKPVERDEILTTDHVEVDTDQFLYNLRAIQDGL